MTYRSGDDTSPLEQPSSDVALWGARICGYWEAPSIVISCTVLARLYFEARQKAAMRLGVDPSRITLRKLDYD